MRFISMHKSTKDMEAGAPPSREVLEGMGPLMGEAMQKGIFLAGEGLRPSSHGVRLNIAGGKQTITKGPLTGSNEVIDRYMIVRAPSIDEAIEYAVRFSGGADLSEIDIRPVTEPWDLGFFPKPPDVKDTRFMIMHKADRESEAGGSQASLAEFARVRDELQRSGVLLAAEALTPTSDAVRLRFRDGRRTVIDGPFAESKELIAGFSIMELPSREEAMRWAERFAALFGEIEIDIRRLRD